MTRIGTITKVFTNDSLGELVSDGVTYLYIPDYEFELGAEVLFELQKVEIIGELVDVAVNLRRVNYDNNKSTIDTLGSESFEIPCHKFGHVTDPPIGRRSDYTGPSGYTLIWIQSGMYISNIGTFSVSTFVNYWTLGTGPVNGPLGTTYAPKLSKLTLTHPSTPHNH